MALAKAVIESQLTSRFGDVFKVTDRRFTDVLPIGIPEIDQLVGGLPRGALTEIFGSASSGRTSLTLSALAHATANEEVCALVDLSNSLDPQSASKVGIALDQLLWLRCDNKLENAFKAADLILQAGGFGLVVLDLGDLPSIQARKIISSWWYRFRRVLENQPTALLVIAQDSCVRSCASLSLALSKADEYWTSAVPTATHARLLQGLTLESERQRPILPGQRTANFHVQQPASLS
jgi:recombination protein RecA